MNKSLLLIFDHKSNKCVYSYYIQQTNYTDVGGIIMDKSKIEEQKNNILKSIYNYSNLHGLDVRADVAKNMDDSFTITVTNEHKEISKNISSDELTNLNNTDIQQIVEQLLKNFYEPRPPRAPTP